MCIYTVSFFGSKQEAVWVGFKWYGVIFDRSKCALIPNNIKSFSGKIQNIQLALIIIKTLDLVECIFVQMCSQNDIRW